MGCVEMNVWEQASHLFGGGELGLLRDVFPSVRIRSW